MTNRMTLQDISLMQRIGTAAVADLPDRGASLTPVELADHIAAFAANLVPADPRGPLSPLAAEVLRLAKSRRRNRETPEEVERSRSFWGFKGGR